ncbi:MAG: Crp/Fnr family transcriptional regulator [Burkholderiales bacterium]|nr:Crp/Fnr family transcriptional regulator [Burkholderiales bacterium]
MVLAELAPQDRATLAAHMNRMVLPPYSLLFQQGEPSDRLWVVESGRARVFQTSEHGHTFTQAVCIGGTSVGLAAVVARARRDTSAETIDTCTLQVMPADVLLALMHTLPGLGAGVARLLASTAMESFARAEALVVQPARVRLARILVSLAGEPASGQEGALQIDGLTQEELARMVGVSRTWVVLSLKQLEERGLIRRYRRRIVIPDGASMMRFVQQDALA